MRRTTGRGPEWLPERYLRFTVTLKLAVAALPLESVAEQRTGVLPTRKNDPERGVHVTGTVPSTTSEPVTE